MNPAGKHQNTRGKNIVLLHGELDDYIIIIEDFIILLPEMDRYKKQKITKDTVAGNTAS